MHHYDPWSPLTVGFQATTFSSPNFFPRRENREFLCGRARSRPHSDPWFLFRSVVTAPLSYQCANFCVEWGILALGDYLLSPEPHCLCSCPFFPFLYELLNKHVPHIQNLVPNLFPLSFPPLISFFLVSFFLVSSSSACQANAPHGRLQPPLKPIYLD